MNQEETPTAIKIKTLAIDAFCGATAACCLAPFIAIVDQAVTEYAANAAPSVFSAAGGNAKMLFFNPRRFFGRPIFFIVWGVYGSTYVVANCIDSMCKFHNKNPTYFKLAGTTAVNMVLGVLKDRWIAIRYNGKPASVFPLVSWSLFLFRDTLTIGAGFTFPPYVSSKLMEKKIVSSPSTANVLSQIGVPIVAQFILTPIHLLSLDFYNNRVATPMQRFKTVMANNVESTMIRWGRVLAAYGIAGLVNTGLRRNMREALLPAQYNK